MDAGLISLAMSAGLAVLGGVVWLVRLEGGVKRAQEKAEGACAAVKDLEAVVDALRPIATNLEVLATRMTALVERVADGNQATRERFNSLDTKIDHALNNARQAREAAAVLSGRPPRSRKDPVA